MKNNSGIESFNCRWIQSKFLEKMLWKLDETDFCNTAKKKKQFCNVIIFSFFQFVAHPNVQQLLASIWYEGLPGFRQMNMILQGLEVCRIGLLFPFFSLAYIICPWVSYSQKLRKPFIKFICTSASYFTFLCKWA